VSGPVPVAVLPEGEETRPAPREELVGAVEAAGGAVVDPADAHAVVWTRWDDPVPLRRTLAELPAVRWVQLVTAGVDRLVPALDTARVWTSAKGCYSRPIAEYALAGLLAGLRSLPGYSRAREWSPLPARSLFGARVTIIGAGGIARALMALLEPFDCSVTVVRHRPEAVPGARRTVPVTGLADVLPGTDVLVVAAALTPQTIGVVDAAALAALPDGAWLVNVGRGAQVVTDALVAELARGRLGGAVLDVTDPEPLPSRHALWSFGNCIITPHSSCPATLATPYLLERVRDNVARFASGADLAGVVQVDAGY
jgi:phosphoglycerate dehydrogenase-like enzyme